MDPEGWFTGKTPSIHPLKQEKKIVLEQERLRGKEGDSLIPDQGWEDYLVGFSFNHCTLDF